jgi:hypothetical protein
MAPTKGNMKMHSSGFETKGGGGYLKDKKKS